MSLLTDGIILSFMTNFQEKRNWLEFSTREISVEPFKLNKRPGRLLDHLRYHIFSCLFRCHLPWVLEVFSRGFAALACVQTSPISFVARVQQRK